MNLTSISFIIFVAISLIVYYVLPEKHRWVILLLASYLLYIYISPAAVIFLLASTISTYVAGIRLEQKKSKAIVVICLLFNLGILGVLKYTGFVLENISNLFHCDVSVVDFILPLGISYYTFQSLGYVLDVYWNRVEAEKNLGRYALFLAFFPQLLQGPIGRYGRLGKQFKETHRFDFRTFKFGIERIAWGLFKKMVLADWAAVYCDAIFADPEKYAGAAAFGVLLYTIELYGNFAGGIDIVLGIATLFGIELDENFERPFFSTSLTDFWHRWHITLGSWMKDYVFYPLTLSKGMKAIGKHSKKLFGRKTGRNIPVCISNLIVFLLVGIWHGANWNNIGWGLYNGVIIAASGLLMPVYEKTKKALHLNDKSFGYRVFMILRTFVIINLSWYFDCVTSLKTAMYMIVNSVTNFHPSVLLQISSGKFGVDFTPYALIILGVGCVILFVVGVLQERGIRIRETVSKLPYWVQVAGFLLMLICVGVLSPVTMSRGFIYAQF